MTSLHQNLQQTERKIQSFIGNLVIFGDVWNGPFSGK